MNLSTDMAVDVDDPDDLTLVLVSDVLTGHNYTSWCNAMTVALAKKNKVGYIDGSISRPNATDHAKLTSWISNDDLVASWISNSVSSTILESIMHCQSAYDMWKNLSERFDKCKGLLVFELKMKLRALTQGQDSVKVYYSRLKSLWERLSECGSDCTCGAEGMEQTITFLMGLDDRFSDVRNQILLMDPIPSVKRVFSLVIKEEVTKIGVGNSSLISFQTPVSTARHVDRPTSSSSKKRIFTNEDRCGQVHAYNVCSDTHGDGSSSLVKKLKPRKMIKGTPTTAISFSEPDIKSSFSTPVLTAGDGGVGPSSGSIDRVAVVEDAYSEDDGSFGSDAETDNDVVKDKPTFGAVSSSEDQIESLANNFLKSFCLEQINACNRATSDKVLVERVLSAFNLLRRKILQIGDPKATRRADLSAGKLLKTKRARVNTKRRIGSVPGIEVGDIFFYRMEMCLVGMHSQVMAGIDYMNDKSSGKEEKVAVCIVSSGGYKDDADKKNNEEGDGKALVYSGQGGDKQQRDQKLEKGNLALEESKRQGSEVRVVRGVTDFACPSNNIYIYDGLYKVVNSLIQKQNSGFSVYKYSLVRVEGQPEAYTSWKAIEKWKDGSVQRPGIILGDLTFGTERYPVCVVNDIDVEVEGTLVDFTYLPHLKYREPFVSPESLLSCTCVKGCPSATGCPCVKRNGGYLPYTPLGVLTSHNSVVHECGSSCSCPSTCKNRISQAGPKIRLEVFITKNKGWGLRSWDPIRVGDFICEYAGEVIDSAAVPSDESYIFDATRTFDPLEVVPIDDPVEVPFPLVINAKNEGNVGRFMNHSCSPNVYWQPILRGNQDQSYLYVGFFAIKHIPPLQELTYNYGTVRTDKAESHKKNCFCGSSACRGYFY